MNKAQTTLAVVAAIVIASLGIIGIGGFAANNEETWTIIQRPFKIGATEQILTENGKKVFIPKWFGTEATYKDMYSIFYSDQQDEGGPEDHSVGVIFKDKGKADFSAQVVIETPIERLQQIEFHKLAQGNDNTIIQTVKSALNEASRFTAAKLTASEFVEGQEAATIAIKSSMLNDELLKRWNIKVIAVKLSNIEPDKITKDLFAKQQDALLKAKAAEAKKVEFEMKKLETEADYAQQIAQEKGKADMIKMKAITDANREKELAEIDAAKKREVAKLQTEEQVELKKKAEVEATRKLEVAKLERLAADESAAAQKVLADAREYQIQKGGAIAEKDKVLAEIGAKRDALVAKELAQIKVPSIVMAGNGSGEGAGVSSSMFNFAIMKMMGLIPEAKADTTVK